jgi:ABC-type nitrate/sulfonate/bicarbonate transport system permease component
MEATRHGRVILEAPPTSLQRIIFTFVVVLLWFLITQAGLINQLLLPSPFSVGEAVVNIGPTLAWHILATTARALIGLLIGGVCGILLGLGTRYCRWAKLVLEPFFDASRPVPAIALLPFFILLFGFSETGRIFLVATSVAVIMAVATVEAAEAIPEPWFRFALVSGLTRFQIFRRIVVPGIIPWLRGPLRIGLAFSFTLVIASEFMGAQLGLGYLINVARINLATPTILLCILILGCTAQLLDFVLSNTIQRLSFWYQGTRSALNGETPL